MLHITPTISPRISKDLKARTTLGKNLEYMGLEPRLMNFPWSITSTTMVNELTQNQPVPEEVQHVVYRAAIHHITEQTIAQIYDASSSGEERPAKVRNRHKEYFLVEKDSTDGYPVDSCLGLGDARHLLVPLPHLGPPLTRQGTHLRVQTSVPIVVEEGQGELDPKPLSVHVQESTAGRGINLVLPLPLSFHFYDQNNALTQNEKADYMAAMANV
jgi:hypothetical protein